MSRRRRLAIATRGLRGGLGEKIYVNEELTLDEGLISVTEVETLRVDTVELIAVNTSLEIVSVDVRSLESLPSEQGPISVDLTVQSIKLDLENTRV